MIELNKLDDSKIIINSDQIESIEQTPDTVITLSNGKKIIVKNSAKEVIKRIINFKMESIQTEFEGEYNPKPGANLKKINGSKVKVI
jgi:flagellar protein FlbD